MLTAAAPSVLVRSANVVELHPMVGSITSENTSAAVMLAIDNDLSKFLIFMLLSPVMQVALRLAYLIYLC
jgi:hypothetical protein